MTSDELILKIREASKDDDKEFQEIIAAVLDGKFFTVRELAHTVDASLPTIRRWKDGVTAPMPGMRPYVFRYLLEKLQVLNGS